MIIYPIVGVGLSKELTDGEAVEEDQLSFLWNAAAALAFLLLYIKCTQDYYYVCGGGGRIYIRTSS